MLGCFRSHWLKAQQSAQQSLPLLWINLVESMAGLPLAPCALFAALCLGLADANVFVEFHNLKHGEGTSLSAPYHASSEQCQKDCETKAGCDCATFEAGTCDLREGCEYHQPHFNEGGDISLFVKLPKHLHNYQVYMHTNTYHGFGSKDLAGNHHTVPGLSEKECAERCDAFDDCDCAVFMQKNEWNWKAGECWLRAQCTPSKFEKSQGTVGFMVLVKPHATHPAPHPPAPHPHAPHPQPHTAMATAKATEAPTQAPKKKAVFLASDGKETGGEEPTEKPSMMLYYAIGGAVLGVALIGISISLLMKRRGRFLYRPLRLELGEAPLSGDQKKFAKDELQQSFESKDAIRYLGSLELALDKEVYASVIPMVYSLQKLPETFVVPDIQASPKVIKAQLCFILDYTGSMSEQIKQAQNSCQKIVDAVKNLKFDHMPGATVDLEIAAVGYNDWDEKTASLKRPVVFVYGGKEISGPHNPRTSVSSFNLGGIFTKDSDAVKDWIKQPLGNGGKVPEELTGALIAASHLPWTAEQRFAVVITDAPCHGKAYSRDMEHDPFCDKETGLTCTGKPEVPLLKLKEQKVNVVVLHTGSNSCVKMCEKFRQVAPDLIHEKVSPSATADRLVGVLTSKLSMQPLTYFLKPLAVQEEDGQFVGPPLNNGKIDLPDVASGHSVEVRVHGKEPETHTVAEDGLIWLGKPPYDPKVVIKRPGDTGFDKWFEAETPEETLTKNFTPDKIYRLTMAVKKQSS